jgi:hypothetical protein
MVNVIASSPMAGAGDGFHPQTDPFVLGGSATITTGPVSVLAFLGWCQGPRRMSHVAITAALALEGLSSTERMVAFSLASYANREQRAFPGHAAAAARAGLTRGRYLQGRAGLIDRGLVVPESGQGGGRAGSVRLEFARTGPWVEAPVNPALFEAVLDHTGTRGLARLLVAALAALADDAGVLLDVPTDELSACAGLTDRSYRRTGEDPPEAERRDPTPPATPHPPVSLAAPTPTAPPALAELSTASRFSWPVAEPTTAGPADGHTPVDDDDATAGDDGQLVRTETVRRRSADYAATRLVNFRLPVDLHDRFRQLVRDAETDPRLRRPA